METDLFTELRESTKRAIEAKGKPKYWNMLVENLRSSASNGHYRLELCGRLYSCKEPRDDQTKMLKDIIENRELYGAKLRENNLEIEITTNISPLPADMYVDRGKLFTEVNLKIDWSD